jgi:NAD(P)-dependent dehydrogenase (short-subunit alcohol dehydrogenase family)
MDLGLEGKVAIVTGGSKGIGYASAMSLLGEGAKVLIAARNPDDLDKAVASAGNDAEGRIRAVSADLSRIEDIRKIAKHCVDTFGRIDILVNNAGSARMGNFVEIADEAWESDWGLKFFGYVRMAREVYPQMLKQGSGVIVNIIGGAAFHPSADYMVGGSANLALNHFTKALAKDGAEHNVRVVGINPGLIATERMERRVNNAISSGMTREEFMKSASPLGRPGDPQEIGDVVTFLCSDRAGFVTGASLTIDGGANPSIMG